MRITPDLVAPSEDESKIAKESSRQLASLPAARNPVIQIPGDASGARAQTVKLPRGAAELLVQLLTEMGKGNAVTLVPVHAQLTTQEAAEILGVSRPFVIKELRSGRLAFHMVGTHRRIFFKDLVTYKEACDQKHHEAINELTRQAQALKMGY